MEQFAHRPVLPREVLQALACRRGGVWADGTLGAGGHADAILQATSPDGRLVGCDRDAAVLEVARRRLLPYGDRVTLRHLDHRHLPQLLDELGLRDLDGILLDLGLSSFQVDDADRGFSFRADGPLDMRMDRRQAKTAADLVNGLPERELRDLLARFGEEPHAGPVARAIVAERAREPFTRTARLAAVIRAAIPRGGTRGLATTHPAIHPATRSFQALRIAVNDEIGYLPELLEAAVDRLRTGGRLAVIAFHSLEDRAVKESFRGMAHRCVCPRDLPRCGCGRPDRVRLATHGAVRPGAEEVRDNPRSRSARLRAVERLEAA
jgi:16S rRNA (cytosine1402-N4)-methyltransferase